MKKLISSVFFAVTLFSGVHAVAQEKMDAKPPEDKSKRPSPPARVTEKIKSGATISIDYSQPSVKGRAIGKDLEPMEGQVWRTGANEATVFETDKTVTVNGASLPAGKYAFFTIFNGADVTLIFNKTANQWGAYKYQETADQLRVKAKAIEVGSSTEKMTFTISDGGVVSLWWGNKKVEFMVM